MSLRTDVRAEQDRRAWGIHAVLPSLPQKPQAPSGWDGKSFPGVAVFEIGAPSHAAVTLLGQRLVAHGHGGAYKQGPGPSFGGADKINVAAFQRAQGWSGKDADGYPGTETWARLMGAPKGAAAVKPAAPVRPGNVPFGGGNVRAARLSNKKDANVGIVQRALIAAGHNLGLTGADGYWGSISGGLTQTAYDLARWRRGHRGDAYKGSPGNQSLQELLAPDYKVI